MWIVKVLDKEMLMNSKTSPGSISKVFLDIVVGHLYVTQIFRAKISNK